MSVAARRPSHTRIRSREEVAARGQPCIRFAVGVLQAGILRVVARLRDRRSVPRVSPTHRRYGAAGPCALHDLCASSHFFTFTTLFFSKREAVRDVSTFPYLYRRQGPGRTTR